MKTIITSKALTIFKCGLFKFKTYKLDRIFVAFILAKILCIELIKIQIYLNRIHITFYLHIDIAA